ncbi:MAG: 50S ribosomal protein L13 [Deferribacterota bacterium]|nr:50S ribosomal protein L13 [Deferribacterota bacterium]
MKTTLPKVNNIQKSWYLIDAEGVILGRLASKIATILMGKTKPIYSTNIDVGDFLIVVNAEKVAFTGNKLSDKKYYKHSGYLGGLKEKNLENMLLKHPEDVIYRAVKGMLPKNRMGRKMLKKLKVYRGDTHPHSAQKPIAINVARGKYE